MNPPVNGGADEPRKAGRPKKKKENKRANGEGCIYQRPDGLWVGQVIIGRSAETGEMVKKVVYGRDHSDIVAKKNALLQQTRSIVYLDADTVTVKEWIEHYLQIYVKNRVRENTFASYGYVTENHVYPHLGTIKLGKLQSIQIQSMVNQILADGNSARTAEYAYSVLRSAIRQALRQEILLRDPTRAVSLPKKKRKEIRPLLEKEWQAILAAAQNYSPKVYTEVLLEWGTGMRRSEILGLKWADIDFDSGNVTIRRAVMNGIEGPKIADTKTDLSRRTLGLPKNVLEELRRHKTRQAVMRLKCKGWKKLDLVFPNDEGDLQVPNTLSKAFARIIEDAKLKDITFHKLRHDHASRLVMKGIHPKKIQAQLGHSSITVTMDTYSHLSPNANSEITAFLDETVPGAPAAKPDKQAAAGKKKK